MIFWKTFLLRLTYYLLFLHYLGWRRFRERRRNKRAERIIVIQDSGIGNMVLLTPFLKNLRENFPSSHITLIEGRNRASDLIKEGKLVDRIIPYPSTPREKWRLLVNLRKEKPDMVFVSFLNSHYEMAIFTYLTGAPIRVGYHSSRYAYGKGCGLLYNVRVPLPDIGKDRDEPGMALDMLRCTDIEVTPYPPQVYLSPEDRKWAEGFLKKQKVKKGESLLGIHPGAGKDMAFKCWPLKNFEKLIQRLSEKKGIKILIVGGKEEEETGRRWEREGRGNVINAAGLTTLTQTAALIENCSLFLSNDSGPMNIAYALHIPLIVIFGPTQVPFPPGERVKIIRKEFPCVPCYHFREITCTHRKCLKSITVEEVLQVLEELL